MLLLSALAYSLVSGGFLGEMLETAGLSGYTPQSALRRVREVRAGVEDLQRSLVMAVTSTSLLEASIAVAALGTGLPQVIQALYSASHWVGVASQAALDAVNAAYIALVFLEILLRESSWLAPLLIEVGVLLIPLPRLWRVGLASLAAGLLLGVAVPALVEAYLWVPRLEPSAPLPASWDTVVAVVRDARHASLRAPALLIFKCEWRGLDGRNHTSEHAAWVLNGSGRLLLPSGRCRLEKAVVYWLEYRVDAPGRLEGGLRVYELNLPHYYLAKAGAVYAVAGGNATAPPRLENGSLVFEVEGGVAELLTYSAKPLVRIRGNCSWLVESREWWARVSDEWLQRARSLSGVQAKQRAPELKGWRILVNATAGSAQIMVPPSARWSRDPSLAYTTLRPERVKPLVVEAVRAITSYLQLVSRLPVVILTAALAGGAGGLAIAASRLVGPPAPRPVAIRLSRAGAQARRSKLALARALIAESRRELSVASSVARGARLLTARLPPELLRELLRKPLAARVMEKRLSELSRIAPADAVAVLRSVAVRAARGDARALAALGAAQAELRERVAGLVASGTPAQLMAALKAAPHIRLSRTLSLAAEAMDDARQDYSRLMDVLAAASRDVPAPLSTRYRELLYEFSQRSCEGGEAAVLSELASLLRTAYKLRPAPRLEAALRSVEEAVVPPLYVLSEWLRIARLAADEVISWALPPAPLVPAFEAPPLVVARIRELLEECEELLRAEHPSPGLLEDVHRALREASELARAALLSGGRRLVRAYVAISLAREIIGEILEDKAGGGPGGGHVDIRPTHW